MPAFGFCRTDSDYNNCRYHHQAVFHTEKTDLSLMNGVFIVMQKIVNDGADKIKPKAENELDMRYSGGPMPCGIINAGEFSFEEPTMVSQEK